MSKAVAAGKAVAVSWPLIYIGPTIPGVAKENTVYNNGLPETLSKKAEEVPAIKALIIPVEKLAAASVELAKPGSALSIVYNKIKQ